MTNFIVM